ncbi:MFS transporter [Candidatus Falkowbacteria bacterium]|nr:MFS transporter [Candidatus Falkowbacteria bacterium]
MATTIEVKRYYLYNFIINAVNIGSGHFMMVYFYLHGFSVMAILSAILTYGLTCLIILKPVGMLIEKIGPQRTFRWHALSEALKYFSLLAIFIIPTHQFLFFILLQWFNGFNVMFNRIPLTAYFSVYGDNDHRGSQIGLTNTIQIVASVIAPVIAGVLIEQTGLILITTLTTLTSIGAIFILRFDGRVSITNPVRFKTLISNVPPAFTKAFFFGKLVYPYAADLLSIYIAIVLQSFTVLGIFVGLRTAVAVTLNYLVGRATDRQNIRSFFVWCTLSGSAFWFIIPFIHHAPAMFILQFTLGLLGIVTAIPFESTYHNRAKRSGNSLQFALWREVATQTGLVVGVLVIMGVLQLGLVAHWQSLLPIGALSMLAMLFVVPHIPARRSSGHVA